jgi:hypothetical protein
VLVMAVRDRPMTELEASVLAHEYRLQFRNAEAFEAAWEAVFGLKTSISLALARRILGEELLKFRARLAGLEAADFKPPTRAADDRPAHRFRCPGCQRDMGEWQRDGHAAECPHVGCYELEVRARIGIASRNAELARRKAARVESEA